ncbi:hypothetical protein H109_07256 [Trichophyton interdigitale MR816]|uniref:Uncharacterized protein n=1 Tax=Trichophyton interdigitale (strain MR816) TaxID=1215338 RepID=A0A059IZC8_TRIIM|nr:hypothetical protein H101_05845 [Trichophyton interdigitale H6]KDB20783.1 hypothetical protein H109_07256 [Trichophyton interdigitale MR816]
MRPGDPRIRQTINQISQNLESANESAQEGIYAFAHHYIEPCFLGVQECFTSCTAPCFPSRDDQLRRRRRERSNGRAEFTFGFYDDWDYDEDAREDGLLGWRNDELDRLLAGSSSARTSNDQPRMNRRMSYGARRRGSILPSDERQDPTVIPSSSILGFLERFPWRIGARGIRYRPSAANLQDNPGGLKRDVPEQAPLLEASDESDHSGDNNNNKDGGHHYKAETSPRKRRDTQSSHETSNSLSSRGDLIHSDEEEDAVPLDDEINIMTLSRHRPSLGSGNESVFSIPHSITTSTKETASSRASRTSKGKGKRRKRDRDLKRRRTMSKSSHSTSELDTSIVIEPTLEGASLADLKREEEEARVEEETTIEKSRLAARELARQKGLKLDDSALERFSSNAREEINSPVKLPHTEAIPTSSSQSERINSPTDQSLGHPQPISPLNSNSQPHTPVSISQTEQPSQSHGTTTNVNNPDPEPHSSKRLDADPLDS